MPSARELKMRQLLEEKKRAILAEQAAKAQKANQGSTPQAKEKGNKATPPQTAKTKESSNQQKASLQKRASATAKPKTPKQKNKSSSKAKSKNNKTVQKTTTLFQALGTVSGLVRRNDEGQFRISLDGQEYHLSVPLSLQSILNRQITEHPDQPLFIRVYPQYWLNPDTTPEIYLRMVYWSTENQWEEPIGTFTLRGLWQISPKTKTPVIAIYRNKDAVDKSGRFKANYLPVEMERTDEVQSFEYQPGVPFEERPKRWFIQGHFKLNDQGTALVWLKDIVKPTQKVPKYKKPRKPNQDTNKKAKQA